MLTRFYTVEVETSEYPAAFVALNTQYSLTAELGDSLRGILVFPNACTEEDLNEVKGAEECNFDGFDLRMFTIKHNWVLRYQENVKQRGHLDDADMLFIQQQMEADARAAVELLDAEDFADPPFAGLFEEAKQQRHREYKDNAVVVVDAPPAHIPVVINLEEPVEEADTDDDDLIAEEEAQAIPRKHWFFNPFI